MAAKKHKKHKRKLQTEGRSEDKASGHLRPVFLNSDFWSSFVLFVLFCGHSVFCFVVSESYFRRKRRRPSGTRPSAASANVPGSGVAWGIGGVPLPTHTSTETGLLL